MARGDPKEVDYDLQVFLKLDQWSQRKSPRENSAGSKKKFRWVNFKVVKGCLENDNV